MNIVNNPSLNILSYLFSRRNLLILISIFFIINNLIWWQKNKFIQGADEGEHLYNSIKIYESKNYLFELLHTDDQYKRPIFHFTAGIFYRLFNNTSYQVSLLNNIPYIILLLVGISKLEILILNTPGILSPLFCMLIPAGAVYSRFFNPDIAIPGLLVWLIYFLKKMNDTPGPRYLFVLILLVIFGGYTKPLFYLFVIPPVLYYLFLSLNRKEPKKAIFNITLLIISSACMLCFLYLVLMYRPYFNQSINDSIGKGKPDFYQHLVSLPELTLTNIELTFLGQLGKTALYIINSYLGGITCLFFILFFINFITSAIKKEDKLSIVVYMLGPVLLSPLLYINREARYFLPLIIPVAIIISHGLYFFWRKKIIARALAVIFILFSLIQYYGISYSRAWVDFFDKFSLFNKKIYLSYSRDRTKKIPWSLPYPYNPLEEIIGILNGNVRNGIVANTCFIYNFTNDHFTEVICKRLGYYTHKKVLILDMLRDIHFTSNSQAIQDINYLILNRSDVSNKSDLSLSKIPLFRELLKELTGTELIRFAEFEQYFNNSKFQLYKQINIYNPLRDRDEQFLIYLRSRGYRL